MKFSQYALLQEKQIILNGGSRYGQIVFLAGGSRSGKDFTASKFMQGELFKIIDVDTWKKEMQELGRLKNKYPEITNLDMHDPENTGKLHMFVKEKGIKNAFIDLLTRSGRNENRLPNIIFNFTMQELANATDIIPKLLQAGYKPKNIHFVWILASYKVAVERNIDQMNKEGGRVVPPRIVLATHKGARQTMMHIINGGLPKEIDGDIKVVLGNQNATIIEKPSGHNSILSRIAKYEAELKELPDSPEKRKIAKMVSNLKKKKDQAIVIKNFSYITVKKAGRSIMNNNEIQSVLKQWVKNNTPSLLDDQEIDKIEAFVQKRAKERLKSAA